MYMYIGCIRMVNGDLYGCINFKYSGSQWAGVKRDIHSKKGQMNQT